MSSSRILICDDDRDLIEMTSMVLSAADYEVDSLSDMHQLKEKVESFQPSIILVDLRMPGIDGIQVIKMIKADGEMKNISILLFSANTELEKIAQSLNVDFIKKPFDINDLRHRIKLLESK